MSIRRAPKSLCGGKYRIDRVLGEGAMGTVYAVTQVRVNRAYALKKLHPSLRLHQDIYQRFLLEGWFANAVAVEHTGAVKVFEDGLDDDDVPFIVMELLEGVAVDALGLELPTREALCIAHQLLDVLHAAHLKGIVHRDIKPANLFICRDGQLKVLDFGISKLRNPALLVDRTATRSLVGTPAFMAPEQARAEASDPRSDLFSVGATLFAMLSGEQLHTGHGAQEVLHRASSEPARSLASVAPEMPPSVIELVAKALAFDPAERWQSAAAMRDAVLQVHHALFGPLQVTGLATLVNELPRPSVAQPSSIGTAPTEPREESEDGPALASVDRYLNRQRSGGEAHFPTLLSPGDVLFSGGTVGLSTLRPLTAAAPLRLRSILTALGFAAGLLVVAPYLMRKHDRPADFGQATESTATAAAVRTLLAAAAPLAPAALAESPRDQEPARPVATPLPSAGRAPAKPRRRQKVLQADGSPRVIASPAPVEPARASRQAPMPMPFLPPSLPLPSK